jgi:hypothetical protein
MCAAMIQGRYRFVLRGAQSSWLAVFAINILLGPDPISQSRIYRANFLLLVCPTESSTDIAYAQIV